MRAVLSIFFQPLGVLLMGIVPTLCIADFPPDALSLGHQSAVSHVQFGASYTYADIKIQGDFFRGSLGGVQVAYDYRPWDSLYVGLKAAWKQGRTASKGAHHSLTYVDVQERIGYTYASPCCSWEFTPFTGLGYRFLRHKLDQCPGSVRFEYNEFYIPVGFLCDFVVNCWIDIGLNFTWMPQIYPTVKISPLAGSRWILKSTWENFVVELPINFILHDCHKFFLTVKPFYEHWKDGRSTAKTSSGNSLGLPANNYNFWGVEVNLTYPF